MTKDEEIYLKSQLTYYKGKCEVYERLLISAGLLNVPKLYTFDAKGERYETTK